MMRYALAAAGAMLLLLPSALPGQELAPLRTAVDGTFAPHAFPSLSGGYEGFNIDLANEIASASSARSSLMPPSSPAWFRRCRPEPTTFSRLRPR
jgi:ABC-type amino acid transport substrate-binding protein